MSISGRKFAITGASRGLGAALAIVMADRGARLVLLARDSRMLKGIADTIHARTGHSVDVQQCDLSNTESCAEAGRVLARDHADLDGLIHNGAMWLPGSLADIVDAEIQACISSAAIGSLILTRHVLPVLRARPFADIHTVVSTSGLANAPLSGTSIAFRAAKAAQDAMVHGLSEELKQTRIRVTAVYPGDFEDLSPLSEAWDAVRENLTNREVVDSILFTLDLPRNARVRALVVE
ncbi:SDR family oxidoreductase [Mesorhizobium australicum]|uniref:Short-chain dehydrogenase n=1 Tax=Mesorhizobium australicum TaxID=536018 RepID=A0A1X7PMY0_9HYPH|nr:SDR family NAD(P)-dependent oxidoreductase [Mesorhizobium australicum]SMH52249.1 Short-chain dehydrogenase [Mesorhizobium australicum]